MHFFSSSGVIDIMSFLEVTCQTQGVLQVEIRPVLVTVCQALFEFQEVLLQETG
jgi:hypothetical protein